jgi:hypothetical protein
MVFAIGLDAGRIGPGDALRDQAARVSLTRRCDQVAGPLIADAGVAGERRWRLRRIANRGEIGQLVNDDLRLRFEDGLGQRFGVEHIDQDRMRAEAAQKLHPFRRTGRSPDRVARSAQKGDKPPADDAGRAGQEYPAHEAPPALVERAFRPADIC